ncbi:hypothetical protein D3C87_807570 [compost metagenome]
MLRRKTWQYIALASEDAFVSAAVAHLGYVGLAFATAYDRRTGIEASFQRLAPFAQGFRVAPELASGETVFTCSQGELRFSNLPRRVVIDVPGFEVTAELAGGAPWPCAWPIGPKGRNETVKDMGVECRGTLLLGSRERSLDGHAMVDWTRGTPARRTAWRWAAGVASVGDRRLAWNLRTGFDDPDQVENALWVDGQPVPPGLATITPGSPGTPWRITAGALDLSFEPDGMRREDLNLGLVASRYQQPWGRYHGTFEGQLLSGYGVVEDHWAIW